MGTQNLNNYNFNKIDAKLDYCSYYDFFLASDEKDFNSEVVWSTNIIGLGDTTVLPLLIDLNDPTCSSQPVTTCVTQYPVVSATPQTSEPFTVLSKYIWLSAKTVCDCSGITVDKKCNLTIGETARSNGLYHDVNIANLQLLPPSDCVEIYKQLPLVSTFNKLHFDKRFKMSQVKGYGLPLGGPTTYFTDTSIMSAFDSTVGYYQDLKGGFYQGFYKLHGYDYEVLPTRPNKGWSFCSYLKLNTIGAQLQDCYNASGYNGISSTTLCSNSPPNSMGNTMPPHLMNYSWKNASNIINGVTNNSGFFFFKGLREGKTSDTMSNALGFRITDDMRIGYRTLRYTGDCVDSAGDCNPNSTWMCGWVLEESYSEPICPFISKSGNCANTWIQVDVVFDRNIYLEDCDLLNKGGINDLISGTYPYSTDNICDTFIPGKLSLDCYADTTYHWFADKDFRMGTLKFYVNGRVVHTVNDYEEIIPRHTNQTPESQFGVSYNMSWGGGAWGYRENNQPKLQSSDLISQFFAGSFIGGISQMMYYIKPLTADEVYHNFLINKERYSLIDCEECKNCPGGCTDCDLPGEETQPPIETATCYNHVWSYCGSVEIDENYNFMGTGGTYDTTFSGATQIVFLDNSLVGYDSCDNCNTNNSNLFWDSVGQPTIGSSMGAHYLTKQSDEALWWSWACFTYMGITAVTAYDVVYMVSSSGGQYASFSGSPTIPWNNSGLLGWYGPWDELSAGTSTENCCLCLDWAGPTCAAECPSGCMAYNAINYGVGGNDDIDPYCDCNGVHYMDGGYDISCCIFDPPCVPGCTDITAFNYDGSATCDCWGVMGGTSHQCCQYSGTGVCVSGCMDISAVNYSSLATCDCENIINGTNYSCCTYTPLTSISGCMDTTSFGYNPIATSDCSNVWGGTDYSCCMSSCDICATNNINGTFNSGQLNNNSYGWTGGTYDNTFTNYQENDTVTYNGCCYLCGEMNVGGYFPCSENGAPDINPDWLSCCPNSCDTPCIPCPQPIPSPGNGNCSGTTHAGPANGPIAEGQSLTGLNINNSQILELFIDPTNLNQTTDIVNLTIEVPRDPLTDCTGCNGPGDTGLANYSLGTTVLWQITGIGIEKNPGNYTIFPNLAVGSYKTWDEIFNYVNLTDSLGITASMDYAQVIALPTITSLSFIATKCTGCS